MRLFYELLYITNFILKNEWNKTLDKQHDVEFNVFCSTQIKNNESRNSDDAVLNKTACKPDNRSNESVVNSTNNVDASANFPIKVKEELQDLSESK